MKMNQVREALAGIMATMGNVNNAIRFGESEAYTSRIYGAVPAKLIIYVEDCVDVIDEEFQDYSEETVNAMEEWLDKHCVQKADCWSNGDWYFNDFKVELEYSCEDI